MMTASTKTWRRGMSKLLDDPHQAPVVGPELAMTTSEFVALSAEIFTSPWNSSAAVVGGRAAAAAAAAPGACFGLFAVPCASVWQRRGEVFQAFAFSSW